MSKTPKGEAPSRQFDDVLKRMLSTPPDPKKKEKEAAPAKNKPAK